MSWELDKTEYKECPCKKGRIRVDHYSDDWNRYDSRYTIECESCKNEYHLETQSSDKPHGGTYIFLVKNGETTSFYVRETSFEEYMVHTYTKEALLVLYEDLLKITSSANVNRNIAKEHKRWYKTAKMSEIRTHVKAAIDHYDDCEYNKKTIELKQVECSKVKRYYI